MISSLIQSLRLKSTERHGELFFSETLVKSRLQIVQYYLDLHNVAIRSVKELHYTDISSKLAVNDNCKNGQVTSFSDLAIYFSVAIFSPGLQSN